MVCRAQPGEGFSGHSQQMLGNLVLNSRPTPNLTLPTGEKTECVSPADISPQGLEKYKNIPQFSGPLSLNSKACIP